MRLIRRGDQITGYCSENGTDWQEMGTANVHFDGVALIGLAVTLDKNNALCTASLEKVSIGGLDAMVTNNPTGPSRAWCSRWLDPQRRGALGHRFGHSPLPRRAGNFHSTDGCLADHFPFPPAPSFWRDWPARLGLVLTSGDVVEGEFRTVADGRVSVSSVLFGLRKFNVSEVAAAILAKIPRCRRQGTSKSCASDGSLLLVDMLSCENGSLIAETSFAGKLKLGQEQIVEIRGRVAIQAADRTKSVRRERSDRWI